MNAGNTSRDKLIQEKNFAMERRLRELDGALHRRFTDAVFGLQHVLSNYKLLFPEYTDHTELHSLTVVDFCNRLIGDRLEKMNADELYVLLMGCYFHDTGMGISRKDYDSFCREIDFGDYFSTHSRENYPRTIRDYHNEFSGLFIRKYAPFFEIPSEEHLWAIIEVARGHRKTSLLDEREYPPTLTVPNGNPVCLPYLSALIRLSDEIDVAAQRSPVLLYDLESFVDSTQLNEHRRHRVVRDLILSEDAFTLVIQTEDPGLRESIRRMVQKMQETLDYCRAAVLGRTPYTITQERVLIVESEGPQDGDPAKPV